MTKPDQDLRCGWCHRKLDVPEGPGRPRAYCRQSCRQRAYEARHHAGQLGLAEGELVMTRRDLEQVLDQIYVLQAAVEDVDRDLSKSNDPAEVRRSLEWLLSAARPLAETPLL